MRSKRRQTSVVQTSTPKADLFERGEYKMKANRATGPYTYTERFPSAIAASDISSHRGQMSQRARRQRRPNLLRADKLRREAVEKKKNRSERCIEVDSYPTAHVQGSRTAQNTFRGEEEEVRGNLYNRKSEQTKREESIK